LKRSFEEVIFFSNIIKTPQSSRDRAKKKKSEKLQKTIQKKGEVNILRGERHFNIKNPF
jgi:hypothetical protein